VSGLKRTMRNTPFLIAFALLGLAATGCRTSAADGAGTPTATVESTAEPSQTAVPNTPQPTATALAAYAVCLSDRVRRPELTWVVDKTRPLPDGYVPDDLVFLPDAVVPPGFEGRQLDAEAAEHFVELVAAAAVEGYDLRARSTYRSYDEQVWTFAYWIEQLGQTEAERISAKPGHSEHQLGMTADVTSPSVGWTLSEAFGETPEGVWLLENAYRFGFGESYSIDGEETTGYAYEPWHIRYVGVGCAESWRESDLTLVEFLEILDLAT